MIKEFTRSQRVEQEIQKNIAIILQHKIKDPRINMATISGVDISHNLAYAKVYVTFINMLHQKYDPVLIINGIKALQNATGYIRALLSTTMRLRMIPELQFIHDNSLMEGMRISTLVTNVVQNDFKRRCALVNDEEV